MLTIAGGAAAALAAVFLPVGVLVASGVGTAALILAAICIQLRFVSNLVEGVVARDYGPRPRSSAIFNDLVDRSADVLVLVAAGYAVSGTVIGPLLGWTSAVLAIMTSYVGLLSSAPALAEASTYPMHQKHRMAVMTGACVVALILPAGFRPMVVLLALAVITLGCGFAMWLRIPKLVKDD